MGSIDRFVMLDNLTGGVTVQPDYQAVLNGASNAYPGRTPELATGRTAYQFGIANAPMTKAEFDNFVSSQAAMSYGRGGAALQQAQTVIPAHKSKGGFWGAIDGVKDVATLPFRGALGALSFAYDEGISQPLSTVFTVLSDGSQWKGGEWGKLTHLENWERAYHIAEHRSPAQAAYLTFMTNDIFDEGQVAKAQGTDLFRIGTGILDGAFNWYLDPLTIVAGGVKGFREGLALAQEGTKVTEQSLQHAVDLFTEKGGTRRWGRTFEKMDAAVEKELDSAYSAFNVERGTYHAGAEALAAARVREKMLKNVTRGDTVAYLLTSAKGPEERLLATKALMGDNRALAALNEHNLALGTELGYFTKETSQIDELGSSFESVVRNEGFSNLSDELQAGNTAVMSKIEEDVAKQRYLAWKDLNPDTALNNDSLFAQLKEAPGQSFFGSLTDRVSSSKMFQSSPMQSLVRVSSVATPRNLMDVSARGADARFDNVLRYMGVHSDEERAVLRGKFIVGNETRRWTMLQEAQEEALRRMATKAGLDPKEVDALVATMKTGQQVGTGILEQAKAQKASGALSDTLSSNGQRAYSNKNRDVIWVRDADGAYLGIHSPLLASQTSSLGFVYNWRTIRSNLADLERLKRRVPGVSLVTGGPLVSEASAFDLGVGAAKATWEGANHIADKFMNVWKPSVLLSPRVGMRNVLLDEGMATLAKVHSVADFVALASTLKRGGHNLVVDELSRLGLNAPEALRKRALAQGVFDVDAKTVPEIVQELADRAIAKQLAHTNAGMEKLGFEPVTELAAGQVARLTAEAGKNADALARSVKLKSMRAGVLAGAASGFLAGGIEGAIIGGVVGPGLAGRLSQWDRVGLSGLKVNGLDVAASIGDRSGLSQMTEAEIRNDHNKITDWLAANEDLRVKGMRQSGGWAVVDSSAPGWGQQWERVTNLQFGQDQLGRKILKGEDPEQLAQWLLTAEGKEYLSGLPRFAGKHYSIDAAREHIDNLTAEIDDLFMKNDNFKQLALEQRLTADHARSFVGARQDLLPSVHRANLEQTQGKGAFAGLKKAVDGFFGATFSDPLDEWSRIPYFDSIYRADVTRRYQALGAYATEDSMRAVEQAARNVAHDETKRMFYDAADRTDLNTILRNIIPFMPAQQDAIERWARITIDNPVFTSRMRSAWMGLDKSVLSTKDENGDQTLQFRLPEFARDLVNHSPVFKHAFDSEGRIAINKNSLNMLTGGGLGFGPVVQFVASKLVEWKPELNDVVGWAIPYGANTNLIDVASPSWLRQAEAAGGDESSRRFMSQFHMVLASKLVDMKLHKRPMIDWGDAAQREALIEEAKKETRNLFKISAFAKFALPVGVEATSPYAKQIEAYRQLQDKLGPEGVDAAFLEQYGEEFNAMVARNDVFAQSLLLQSGGDRDKARQAYVDKKAPHGARETFIAQYGEAYSPLTAGSSKGVLPSTTEAYRGQQKMGDLVAAYPELASLIVGKEGVPEGAKFNRAVFDHQFATGDRTLNTPDELITNPETQLGWDAFTRGMDTIDSLYYARYGDTEHAMPADLAYLKQQLVMNTAQKYKTWYDDYVDVDGSKWKNRIEGMTHLANDPRAKDRPGMAGLREYLTARQQIQGMLAARAAGGGHSSLAGNPDLAALWHMRTRALVEKSTDFGAMYNRWLENDPLTRDPTQLGQVV